MTLTGITTILDLLVLKTWACINAPVKHINPLFHQILSSQAILSEIISAAGLTFCPGLLEVIQCITAPSLGWFEALPTAPKKVWGIYVLILKKQHFVPLLYIGSGTAATRAVKARFGEYDRRYNLPQYLEKALNEGYDIVHKGLLLHCPLPVAANVPMLRIAFVAMEAAFSFMFWTMHSRTKDYGCGGLCPWDRDSFEWYGLCSHNPLLDSVSGNFDLTGEQLEEMAAVIKEKNRVYQVDYGQSQRARSPDRMKAVSRRNNKRRAAKGFTKAAAAAIKSAKLH